MDDVSVRRYCWLTSWWRATIVMPYPPLPDSSSWNSWLLGWWRSLRVYSHLLCLVRTKPKKNAWLAWMQTIKLWCGPNSRAETQQERWSWFASKRTLVRFTWDVKANAPRSDIKIIRLIGHSRHLLSHTHYIVSFVFVVWYWLIFWSDIQSTFRLWATTHFHPCFCQTNIRYLHTWVCCHIRRLLQVHIVVNKNCNVKRNRTKPKNLHCILAWTKESENS